MNSQWNATVFIIHKQWQKAEPSRYTPHSTKFQEQLFDNTIAEHEPLYPLLKTILPTEEELLLMIDKLGKWFLRQTSWSEHKHRRMVTRSLNRYLNDNSANKSLQLLAIIASHEYTNAWKLPT